MGIVEGCPEATPARRSSAVPGLWLTLESKCYCSGQAPSLFPLFFPQIPASAGPFPGGHTAIAPSAPTLGGAGGVSLASGLSMFEERLFSSSGRLSGGRIGSGAASLGQTAWNSATGSGPAPPLRQRRGAGTSRVPPWPGAWGCSGCPGMLWFGIPRDALVWGPWECSSLGSPGMLRFWAGGGGGSFSPPGAGPRRMWPLTQQRWVWCKGAKPARRGDAQGNIFGLLGAGAPRGS